MNAFLQAVTQQHADLNGSAVNTKLKQLRASPVPPAIPSTPIQPITMTVDRVLARKRLDLFFSGKPSDAILQVLRDGGFHFRPSDKAWYHADTVVNRVYLADKLGVFFDPDLVTQPDLHASTPEAKPLSLPVPEFHAPEYTRFRTQVDELQAKLNMSAADMMIMAIECLHAKVFGAK